MYHDANVICQDRDKALEILSPILALVVVETS